MVPDATNIDSSISGLFATLKDSLTAACTATPSESDITPPADGISLLDVKTELLLSYLHNLVFLILLKIRQAKSSQADNETDESLDDHVVKQLVQLRVYLEKGVRPLEGRLKYQIDKVLRAADDAARRNTSRQEQAPSQKTRSRPRKANLGDDDDEEGTEMEDDSSAEDIDELSYRPNPAAMLKAVTKSKPAPARTSNSNANTNGLYKPPRIAATAMPTPRDQRSERRPQRSAAVDEYISTELSAAPRAEPSIGSTIVAGGRRSKSDRERADDTERRDYEETNFVRLPKESKADRAKKGRRDRGAGSGALGGEDLGSIGAGLDRIDRLTQKKGGRSSKLDISRKRAVEDGPRGDGVRAGDMFAKRRKLDTRKNRR